MKANRAFELLVSRDTREPAFLADPRRHDRIEVVSIDDREVVMFWELPVREAAKLARHLREDLSQLDAEEFIRTWGGDGS
jgi:hypothetical protein